MAAEPEGAAEGAEAAAVAEEPPEELAHAEVLELFQEALARLVQDPLLCDLPPQVRPGLTAGLGLTVGPGSHGRAGPSSRRGLDHTEGPGSWLRPGSQPGPGLNGGTGLTMGVGLTAGPGSPWGPGLTEGPGRAHTRLPRPQVTAEEIGSQVALEYGQAMTVRVCKADGETVRACGAGRDGAGGPGARRG